MAAFFVSCTGQIEKAELGDLDDLYCRYAFHFGPDWTIVAGIDTGVSQIAKNSGCGYDSSVVWNFPIDAKFKSTNPFGWPRVAVSVAGVDFLGRDVIRGYGSALIPVTPGSHIVDITVYTPQSSSLITQWASWFSGNPPEFFDSKFVCQSDGREVTRVRTTGVVRLKLNVSTKGMEAVGYSTKPSSRKSAAISS
eukprot:CAMPEP_0185026190 /NCGR_PEP_ID=MMETSP1103-20130426/10144_1 /TAXON_ID=36769 /ORGANISM="Paraphysomonas bandaiensis, Strain Caron Lab Isolate" /LENGTH=193 /DNA_ID=CAMNT_0027559685 /DNA_START=78 /DNA_END=659 /DNA_ORIENTATION=+